MSGDTQPQKPTRRMPDNTPCWCVNEPSGGEGTWTHSPRCLAIRALQGGYDFRPEPGATNRRRKSVQATKKSEFLRQYAQSGIMSTCCDAVGIDQSTVYRWRDADPVFATLLVWASEHAIDLLEDEARRRAVKGVPKGVYHQGELVATEQQYSDTLLIFLLKGARPSKYRENIRVEIDVRKVAEEVAARAGGGATAEAILAEAERILAEDRG